MDEGDVVFNGEVIYHPEYEVSNDHKHFCAYQRLASGTGDIHDLHTYVNPIWKEIFDAANSEPNPISIGQLLRKYPNRILANARSKLSRNLTSTEEKIFAAKMHGDQFYMNLEHLDEVFEKVYNVFDQSSGIKDVKDIQEASPEHIGAIKTKFLWRAEKFKQALNDLSIDDDVPKLIEDIERGFDIIERAYNASVNSPAVGQVC